MKTIKVHFEGTNGLMLNNPQTVNPLNNYSKALKELTSKRTKTDEDQEEILKLKFLASAYIDSNGKYIIPCNMIMRCLQEAAKENKLGKKFERSVFVLEDAMLDFKDKNLSPLELYNLPDSPYIDIRPVGIMKAKVITARMIIPEWSLDTEITFDENVLNQSEIFYTLNVAGLRYGIGTYRQCYGKFNATEIKEKKK